MARQRNVRQQQDDLRSTMLGTARRFEAGQVPEWLPNLIAQHGIDTTAGSLVELFESPDQCGWLFSGTWVSCAGRFWEFSVLSDHSTCQVLRVERFAETTAETDVRRAVPGIGKSPGQIALEVATQRFNARARARDGSAA